MSDLNVTIYAVGTPVQLKAYDKAGKVRKGRVIGHSLVDRSGRFQMMVLVELDREHCFWSEDRTAHTTVMVVDSSSLEVQRG